MSTLYVLGGLSHPILNSECYTAFHRINFCNLESPISVTYTKEMGTYVKNRCCFESYIIECPTLSLDFDLIQKMV